MKKRLLLTCSVVAAVVILFASKSAQSQEKKEIKKTIIINDRDTIIDGKKLSEVSPAERKALLKELAETRKDTKGPARVKQGRKEEKEVIIKRRIKDPKGLEGHPGDSREFNFRFQNGDEHAKVFRFNPDSLMMAFGDDSLTNEFRIKIDGLDSSLRKGMITMNRRFRRAPGMLDRPQARVYMDEPEVFGNAFAGRRNNSQDLSYVSTDKDGVVSRMNLRISEASPEIINKLNGNTPELNVNDLTLSPNFSTGKLNLSFNLSQNGPVEVKLFDRNLKELFKDKQALTTQVYFKQLSIQKNGLYFIRISQGSKTYIRQMIKE